MRMVSRSCTMMQRPPQSPRRIRYSSVKRRHSGWVCRCASAQDLTLSIPLFPAFRLVLCYVAILSLIAWCRLMHVVCRDISVYGYSCLFFPSSRRVINGRFLCHNVELSVKIIWSSPVHGIWFLLFRHVVVSLLMVISVSVSRCQLSIKSFNHISIVGICLATLLYPLFHFSVSLTIVSRFYLLVNWTWNQSRNCYSRHGRALCWAQRHDLSTSLNQTSVVGIRLDLWFQLFSILFR